MDTKEAGKKGGQSKSPAKVAAARANVARARAARKTSQAPAAPAAYRRPLFVPVKE